MRLRNLLCLVSALVALMSGTVWAGDGEEGFWRSVVKENAIEEYELYLGQYPRGKYVEEARRRIEQMKEQAQLEAEMRRLNEEREKSALAARRKEEERRRAEAEALRPGRVFKDCADCPEMLIVPAGSFEMGSNDNDTEKPVRRVTLKGFALGKTEVTQGQWKAVMGSNPSHFSSCGDDCPVEKVSWNDAQEFVRKLSQKTGKTYRLTSEAEWEYACRAGGTHTYCGSDSIDSVAWHDSPFLGNTHPVAGKQPNAWGLYDMSGNVLEWTEDCWNGSYNGAPVDGGAWTSGDCGRRVNRGGSWNVTPQVARLARRVGGYSWIRLNFLGFRLARMLP